MYLVLQYHGFEISQVRNSKSFFIFKKAIVRVFNLIILGTGHAFLIVIYRSCKSLAKYHGTSHFDYEVGQMFPPLEFVGDAFHWNYKNPQKKTSLNS